MKQKIELYSESFREVLGTTTPWIVRWGILWITILVLFLVGSSMFINCPDKVKGNIQFESGMKPTGYMLTSSERDIRVGQSVDIFFKKNSKNEYGNVRGYVKAIVPMPHLYNNGKVVYKIQICLSNGWIDSNGNTIPYILRRKGTAVILLKNNSLFEQLFGFVDI